jgi:hypothetical protein
MSFANGLRSVGMVLLSVWGIANLLAALRVSEAPLLRRARLLGGGCGLLMASALLAGWVGYPLPALLLGLAGLGCGLTWLYMLFKQSLHNTTM